VKQQKKEELAKQKEKEAAETREMAEQEGLKELRDKERAVTRKKHEDLHYWVQQLQAQLDGLMAKEAGVAENLLDQGEMLEAQTIQGRALVEGQDVVHFPEHKRPKEFYPQQKPPTQELPRTSKQAEYGIKSSVFLKYRRTKFFYRYELRMDDLPANMEVATIMFNRASDVWRSIVETDKDAMIFPFLELHRRKYRPLNDDGKFPPT